MTDTRYQYVIDIMNDMAEVVADLSRRVYQLEQLDSQSDDGK